MALPPLPTIANGRLMAATNEGWDQFYVDYLNGTDGAGVAGSSGAPWKSLVEVFNSRLGAGGSHDHNGQACIVNVRNAQAQGNGLAAGTDWNIGSSATTTQSRGGTLSAPWVIRTDPAQCDPYGIDSGNQAKQAVRLVFNSSCYYMRFENMEFGGSLVTDFDCVQVAGARFIQFYSCEFASMAQNGPQYLGNSLQIPTNCGTYGCRIHDGGDDVGPGPPHDHGVYVGSGAGVIGSDDCYSVNDCIYRMTGYAIQMYEKATRMLIAHATVDEISYPPGVQFAGGFVFGGTGGDYSRECLIVNTMISTIQSGTSHNGIAVQQSGVPDDGLKNHAHHNGFNVACPNEDTSGDGMPNSTSFDGNNVDADPLYVNRTGRDYHLQEGSPLYNAGDATYTPPLDFDGNARTVSTIGAFRAFEEGEEPPASPSQMRIRSRRVGV